MISIADIGTCLATQEYTHMLVAVYRGVDSSYESQSFFSKAQYLEYLRYSLILLFVLLFDRHQLLSSCILYSRLPCISSESIIINYIFQMPMHVDILFYLLLSCFYRYWISRGIIIYRIYNLLEE